jgi:hypothetical protein
MSTPVFERNPELTAHHTHTTAGRVPGELVFVTGMMSRMLART